jgi:hypothetical protein
VESITVPVKAASSSSGQLVRSLSMERYTPTRKAILEDKLPETDTEEMVENQSVEWEDRVERVTTIQEPTEPREVEPEMDQAQEETVTVEVEVQQEPIVAIEE